MRLYLLLALPAGLLAAVLAYPELRRENRFLGVEVTQIAGLLFYCCLLWPVAVPVFIAVRLRDRKP